MMRMNSARLCRRPRRRQFRYRLDQRLLRHLAESGQWKIVHDLEPLGQLELGDLLGGEETDQLVESQSLPLVWNDAGAHALAQGGVGHGDASRVLHRRMLQDQILDLLAADL